MLITKKVLTGDYIPKTNQQVIIPHNCIYWYDIESYINFFSICIERETDNARWQFEISEWYHQGNALFNLLMQIKQSGGRMGGFNNYGFDYPLLHLLMQQQGNIDAATLKHKCNHLIQCGNNGDRFSNIIWDDNQFVPQLDLMKIHHFDNKAKMTSLKLLEFNMRMDNIIELPYPPNHKLTLPESRKVLTYNWHDVKATRKLGELSKPMIEFRDNLTEKYGKNFTNHNDTKIGADFFIMQLGDAGVRATKHTQSPRVCVNAGEIILPYVKFEHPEFQRILDFFRKAVIPTEGQGIKTYFAEHANELTTTLYKYDEFYDVAEFFNCGNNYIDFDTLMHAFELEMNHIIIRHMCVYDVIDMYKTKYAKSAALDSIKKEMFRSDMLNALDGFHVVFGGGGIHASLSTTICTSSETHQILDSDVASFYPNLAIKNKFYPEHLTEKFCDVYLNVYNQRKSYPKKTAENNMMKLALNGVYGKSNDVHSPFLDPKYTLSTTINGQLLLCMLVEQLIKIPGLIMIQMNTDGVTYSCPREYVDHAMLVSEWWEDLTQLELEHAPYERMPIRDVNNYMAKTDKWKIKDVPAGTWLEPDDFNYHLGNRQYATISNDKNQYVKRIGCYAHQRIEENSGTRELTWNKDHSAIVVAKAAEAALMYDQSISEFIHNHDDIYDFFLRTKIPKNSYLLCGDDRVQNVSRYYVSETGGALTKVMPPTDKLIEKWRTVAHWKHRENGNHANASKAPSGKYDLCPAPSELPPDRRMSIQKGYLVTVCNNISGHEFNDINYDYYIDEARKLVDELK